MSLIHQLALTFIPGIGCVTARALVDEFGGAEEVFRAKRSKITAIPGIGNRMASLLANKACMNRAEAEIAFLVNNKVSCYFYTDAGYPSRLKNCYDAPLVLYYRGSVPLNAKRVISIVGTRNATGYGKELSEQLTAALATEGVLVVSGLAYGIDGMAHKACVKHRIPTIGVLGHGLDRMYPQQHRALSEKMLEHGGLLTEFPSGTMPDRENFPKRNRIIAGMSDATIVIEAGLKGGALITAELANSYNRDVCAFPGNVFSEFSSGCNYLIKTNRAHLIAGFKDLAYLLGWSDPITEKPKQTSLLLNFSPDERAVTDILVQDGGIGIDDLCIRSGMPQSKLVVTILGLEMQGIVIALPGKRYRMA